MNKKMGCIMKVAALAKLCNFTNTAGYSSVGLNTSRHLAVPNTFCRTFMDPMSRKKKPTHKVYQSVYLYLIPVSTPVS